MFDFFKKKKEKDEEPEMEPLSSISQTSVMVAIPRDMNSFAINEDMFNNLNSIDGFELLSLKMPSEEKPHGNISFRYKGQINLATFMYLEYDTSYIQIDNDGFSAEEVEEIKSAKMGLLLMLKFIDEVQEEYHLQLKIMKALVPDMLALIDDSAMKVINKKWLNLAIASSVMPDPSALYSIHAVRDGEQVWLHTHGLTRCGLSELEILGSTAETYRNHFQLISALASRQIGELSSDENDDSDEKEERIIVGQFSNGAPIIAETLIWTEGIKAYDENVFGGAKDRFEDHNSLTSIIFLSYPNDAGENLLYNIDKFDDLLNDNPIYLLTDEQTKNMSLLAKERVSYLKKALELKGDTPDEYLILAKMGLDVDSGELEKEHIWFEVLEIYEDSLKARLTQEPYYIENLHTDDVSIYPLEDLTDWLIYTSKGEINPNSAYKLD